jgi:hypothetical protein
MRANRLQNALTQLSAALHETKPPWKKCGPSPIRSPCTSLSRAASIGTMPDTKSGKRHETAARLSWQTACELGFRGTLGEWERLMGAAPKR